MITVREVLAFKWSVTPEEFDHLLQRIIILQAVRRRAVRRGRRQKRRCFSNAFEHIKKAPCWRVTKPAPPIKNGRQKPGDQRGASKDPGSAAPQGGHEANGIFAGRCKI